MNILDALDDKRLFGSAMRDASTWKAWRAFLAALFGLPMSEGEAAVYRQCTARAGLPMRLFAEAWLVCGRRSGKSAVLALIAVFLAVFRDYREYLRAGERATIMIVAADRKQARICMRYVRGLLETPALAGLVIGETAESIDLQNQVTIEVGTASYKTLRGYTIAAALCDEISFWGQEDSAIPDVEILAALRPAMATIPNALLLCASSPYAKRGALWNAYKRYYGVDDPNVLVWRATTRTMNPTVPQRIIDEAFAADPASAASEYGAEFRTDVGAFLDLALIESATDSGVVVRPPRAGVRYVSGCDPSGGVADSFTLAIAHLDDGTAVLDCLLEIRAPFNPTSATQQMADALKSYGLRATTGDKYAAEWVVDAFAKLGVEYKHSERDRSAIYLDVLPLFTSGRARLLDVPRLASQFAGLERRTSSIGKDRVDHGQARGAHDDLCNSAALALVIAAAAGQPMIISREAMIRAGVPQWRIDNPRGPPPGFSPWGG